MTLALVGGWRFLARGPAAAAERPSVDPSTGKTEVIHAPASGAAPETTVGAQAAKVDVAVGPRPIGAPRAEDRGDESYDPDDVSGTQPRSVAPQAGRSGRPPRPDLSPAAQGEARSPSNADKRRRRPPRRASAPAAAAAAAEAPRINLKRGDVVPTF
jgi:hypothetical protein